VLPEAELSGVLQIIVVHFAFGHCIVSMAYDYSFGNLQTFF
jgi:hypothetical protein